MLTEILKKLEEKKKEDREKVRITFEKVFVKENLFYFKKKEGQKILQIGFLENSNYKLTNYLH